MEVLHVDDEPDFADLTATFLEREDHQFTVETATTGDDGLERIDDRRPDCIVSDYNMPGMNGLEFLQAVRERYPDLPFILFTGKGSESIASDAISAGVTDYLQKGSGTERYELLANRIRNAVRARREAQRVDRQRQLTRLTEFAGDTGGWELDRESGTVLLTAGTRRIIGRPDQAEISLEEAIALFHPDDHEDIQQTLTRAFETGEELHNMWRLQLGDGDERLIEMTITPVVESGGKVTKLRGAGHDITDRKERRQELEKHETIIEALTDAVYVLDEEGRFTYVSDELVELVGYDRETILGSTPSLIKDEDAVERAEHHLGRLLSSDGLETVKFEVTIQPCDGDPIVCEDHMGVLPYEGDEFDGSVGTLRDITERKERARELELKSQTMDEAPVGITITDPDREDNPLIYVNEGFEALTGYSEAEILGRNCRFLQGEATREEPVAEIRKAVEKEEPVSVELRNYRKDGRQFWNRVSIAPVRDDAGTVENYVGFQENVSERKERARKLERQNARLKDFVGIVSHDLRNPLTTAQGRLELAQADCDSAHLDAAGDAVDRCQALVEDLLALARSGNSVGITEPVTLSELAEVCWQTTPIADATLSVETDTTISADRSRLRQLLENLFRNAVDHGGCEVTVTVGAVADGFYVADDGSGIPDGERDEIFEAGYSIADDGTGFGLAIVTEIVEAHGWEIRVTDSETGGARFEITGVETTG
ncbi:PAS domain S-box protein [Salinibaculum salinum]|uniref:PAS domain S-box protein n=1 Tax=Salinibaculum salinum TaxID=3131996 RepID=UPI0030EC1884